ncbi:MAG: crosslink repair DNA glycosylase YcaQ family protein [bacterium]|nr:crosslink repair DNA glycosylase YcaQ family protein [bacterium]
MRVSREQARRFLVNRSGFGGRWAGPLMAVRGLGYVQVDPIQVVERNHHLVLRARVPSYQPEQLDHLLYRERELVEVVTTVRCIVPVETFPLFLTRFRALEARYRPGLSALEPTLEAVLGTITERGPMSPRCFDSREKVEGWWDPDGEAGTRAVSQALEWLWHFGRIVIHHREGNLRYFDLPERVLGPVEPRGDDGHLARLYFSAVGLADPRDVHFAWGRLKAPERKRLAEEAVARGEVLPVAMEDGGGLYYLPAGEEEELRNGRPAEGGLRFLPPLDNLIIDRRRTAAIFGFDYTWEAYLPPARRTYGPYTMAILAGEELVGRFAPRLNRRQGVLQVEGVWWQREPQGGFRDALEEWARWQGAQSVEGMP